MRKVVEKINALIMNRIRLIVILNILIWIGFNSSAQTSFKLATVGERVSDVEVSGILNYSKEKVKLSDFKDKLLIIDFWATWCTPCIAAFPKMHSLQKKFGQKIQILPVTRESPEIVDPFLKKMAKAKSILPMTATNDKVLNQIFKHTVLPHYVWINKGVVIGITEWKEVSETAIKAILDGKEITLPEKKDMELGIVEETGVPVFAPSVQVRDASQPEGKTNKRLTDSNLLMHSTLSRYVDGLASGTSFEPHLITARNTTILSLYRIALLHNGVALLNRNNVIVDIRDSSLYEIITARKIDGSRLISPGLEARDWLRKNGYSYEIKTPLYLAKEKFNIMLTQLNEYFGSVYGIEGVKELRNAKYLALQKVSSDNKLATKGMKPSVKRDKFSLVIENMKMQSLLNNLASELQTSPPIIDETGHLGNVDLELNCQLSDLAALNGELAKYGLRLIEKEKMMEIGVIRLKHRK